MGACSGGSRLGAFGMSCSYFDRVSIRLTLFLVTSGRSLCSFARLSPSPYEELGTSLSLCSVAVQFCQQHNIVIFRLSTRWPERRFAQLLGFQAYFDSGSVFAIPVFMKP